MLMTGGYGAGTAMIRVEKKGSAYEVTELFKNPDFGAHTQPPILHKDHFYSHFTVNEPIEVRWGTLRAWAFGMSRAIDALVTMPAIDATRIATVGHSRRGKVALITAAFDERVSIADDPLDPAGLPKAFDAEGTPKQRVELVRDGIAVGVAWDRASAARAGNGAAIIAALAYALLWGGSTAYLYATGGDWSTGVFVLAIFGVGLGGLAWLLTRRAVARGELGESELADPRYALGDAARSDPALVAAFPFAARALIDASQDLYARIERMQAYQHDEQVGSDHDVEVPVHSLIHRLENAF